MPRRPNKTGLWHGFTRPIWRDRAIWLALGLSVALIIVQVPFWGLDDPSLWTWVAVGVDVAITIVIAFAIIGTIWGFFRGFKQGVIEGLEPREGDLEHKARSVGRVLSRRRRVPRR